VVPAHLARHSLEQVLPSYPHTGLYSLVQTHWAFSSARARPAPALTIQETDKVMMTSEILNSMIPSFLGIAAHRVQGGRRLKTRMSIVLHAQPHLAKIAAELERRGIEFTNGGGIGVRLDHAKAAEFARTAGPVRNEPDQ
jgi:hypothetical protein